MLMPDTTRRPQSAVGALREQGFTAVKLGWGPLGKDPAHDVRLAAAAKEAAGDGEILIDAGLGYVADAKVAIGVARELEQLGIFWLEEPFEPDEYEAYAELADAVDIRVAGRRAGHDAVGLPRADRARSRRSRPARRDALRRDHRMLRIAALAARGVETVPHAWKSGIIKAASLHVNAVLPDAIFQEYCVADTPINQTLVKERMPVDADGFIAVPTGPGLGIELDEDVLERYRIS